MIKDLTKKYIELFAAKNISGLNQIIHQDSRLTDPMVDAVGKDKVMDVFSSIFNQFTSIEFTAKNIYIEGNVSIIEFELNLDSTKLVGTDIIEWEGDKIKALRAYLYQSKVDGL